MIPTTAKLQKDIIEVLIYWEPLVVGHFEGKSDAEDVWVGKFRSVVTRVKMEALPKDYMGAFTKACVVEYTELKIRFHNEVATDEEVERMQELSVMLQKVGIDI